MHYKGEYTIKNIVASVFGLYHSSPFYYDHKHSFKNIIDGAETLQTLQEFFTLITHNEFYHDRLITSGVYMCAFAIALGYREIYLAGIDLYSGSGGYAFDTRQPNLLKILPDYDLKPESLHFPETDLEALAFLAKHYGARFSCLCPSSPLARHIPLAPVRVDSSVQGWEQAKPKPADATRDMLIPSTNAYKKLYYGSSNTPFSNPLHKNSIYRFFYDIVRLPNHIKHYIRAKKRYKPTAKERPNG